MTYFLLTAGGISKIVVNYDDANRTLRVPVRLYHYARRFQTPEQDLASQAIICKSRQIASNST
jgi:hypothetical protein